MNTAPPESWAADQALARRCVLGDEKAWSELIRRFGRRIFSHCRLAGLKAGDAEDVCQEVLVSAFRSMASFRGCSLSTWLYRLTRRRLADYYRSPQRRLISVGEPLSPTMPAPAEDPVAKLSAAEDAGKIHRAIETLNEPLKGILIAYYLYETPIREIARESGIPINTIKSHLHRGRKHLRGRLEVQP